MDRLEQTELFQAASCIALYHAIPGEVQTAGFIEKWYRKKKLLLPLIVGDDLRLLLYEGPESLKPGPFGILEPKADGIEVPKNEIDLIIVPGVAFDKDKNRMGRGRGFYDRLLSTLNGSQGRDMLWLPADTTGSGRAVRQENGLRNNRRHHLLISPQNIYLLGQAIYTYRGWAVYVTCPSK